MAAAPIIVIAQVHDVIVSDEFREVDKPAEIGGPMVPQIRLYPTSMSATVLATLRGPHLGQIKIKAWVWASGKHGGPRLFSPAPGSVHVLFLKSDGVYLRTVGDYPHYDLPIRDRWLSGFIAAWDSDFAARAGLMERLVAVRLKAELDSIQSGGQDYWLNTSDLDELAGHDFVLKQLEAFCNGQHATHAGRIVACRAAAQIRR